MGKQSPEMRVFKELEMWLWKIPNCGEVRLKKVLSTKSPLKLQLNKVSPAAKFRLMVLSSPPSHSLPQAIREATIIWKKWHVSKEAKKGVLEHIWKKPWVWLLFLGTGQNIGLASKSLWLLKTNKQTNHFGPLSHISKRHTLKALFPQGLLTLEIRPLEAPPNEGSQGHGEQWSWELLPKRGTWA